MFFQKGHILSLGVWVASEKCQLLTDMARGEIFVLKVSPCPFKKDIRVYFASQKVGEPPEEGYFYHCKRM